MISFAVALLILALGITAGFNMRWLASEIRAARARYAALTLGVGALHQTR